MSTPEGEPTGAQPTEEELRAAYEAELKKIRVEHVLLEHIVTLVNLGMRRTGLAPGTESERDPEQVRLAIEGVRALLPLVEQAAPEQAAPIRDALSRLQLAFVRVGGQVHLPARPVSVSRRRRRRGPSRPPGSSPRSHRRPSRPLGPSPGIRDPLSAAADCGFPVNNAISGQKPALHARLTGLVSGPPLAATGGGPFAVVWLRMCARHTPK